MFNDTIINNRLLKIDVGVILDGMINMRHIKSEIEKIVYDEFGDELDAKDKIIETKDQELAKLINHNREYKKGLEKLKEIEGLNPEAKKIISSLMLL